jgi:hypothetical protein
MPTILSRMDHEFVNGLPTGVQSSLDRTPRQQKAVDHFLKYCDSDRCIRGREYVFHSRGWHEGACLECAFNPYNMTAPE